MAIRYAAAAGVAAVVAALGAFLLIPHHKVLGTNGIARLGPFLPVDPGKSQCERVPNVPAGSGYIRIGAVSADPAAALDARKDFSRFGPVHRLRVTVGPARAPIASGTVTDADSGTIDVPLDHPAKGTARARVCVSNLGDDVVTLYGEGKHLGAGPPVPVLAVTWLDSGSTSWLSHPGVILSRFRDGHGGAIGAWALWLATALMLLAAGLAFWLMLKSSRRA
jgi:hypothetical protein